MSNMKKNKTFVWSFIGRLSHWILVISFLTCFITSFYEELLTLHISLGIIVFSMLLMKIVWGIIGPKYARWSDFNFSLSSLKLYFIIKVKDRYREIEAGHNPASSWFAFLLTWFGILCCISGFVLYGIQEGNGLFSFMNETYFYLMNLLENIHVILVYVIIVIIVLHISGVMIEQFYHKTNMVMAMVTGFKNAKGKDIKTTSFMNLLGGMYILATCLLAFYSYNVDNNIFTKSKFDKIDYKALHEDFYFECSDCHNLFPPHLLPKESWIALMKSLDKHYEEDLELETSLIKSIEKFLIENASHTSTREASYKLAQEIRDSNKFTITKTTYWKETHKNISKDVFKSDEIETKSNCVACHKDFEYGILSDINITQQHNK